MAPDEKEIAESKLHPAKQDGANHSSHSDKTNRHASMANVRFQD